MPQSPQQIAAFNERLDKFAELLSLDIPIPEIRERMGLTHGAAFSLMQALRRKFGWQAA